MGVQVTQEVRLRRQRYRMIGKRARRQYNRDEILEYIHPPSRWFVGYCPKCDIAVTKEECEDEDP